MVGVGEEQASLGAEHDDARDGLVLGMSGDIGPLAAGSRALAQHGDVRAVDPVQQQRDGDPDEQPGQGVEDQDAEQRRIRPPLLRSELLEALQLGSFRPSRGFQGSNVPVPPDVAAALAARAAPRLEPLPPENG
jgi:hypothetical protein